MFVPLTGAALTVMVRELELSSTLGRQGCVEFVSLSVSMLDAALWERQWGPLWGRLGRDYVSRIFNYQTAGGGQHNTGLPAELLDYSTTPKSTI